MEIIDSTFEAISFAVKSYRNKEIPKLYVMTGLSYLGAYILFGIALVAAVILGIMVFGGVAFSNLGKEAFSAKALAGYIAPMLVLVGVLMMVFGALSYLLVGYFLMRFISYAMAEKKLGVSKNVPLVRFALLMFSKSLAVLSSWYDKRGLCVLLVLVLAMGILGYALLGALGSLSSTATAWASIGTIMIFFMAGMLALLVASIVWAYNGARLAMCEAFFMAGKTTGIRETLRASWKLSQGNTIPLIVALFIGWLVVLIIGTAASVVLVLPFAILQFLVPGAEFVGRSISYVVILPLGFLFQAYVSVSLFRRLLEEKKLLKGMEAKR